MINEIAEQCGEPNLPQQIYEACLKKQAFLFVRDRAGCVLKPFIEGGIPAVLVWVAWSERHDGMDEYTEFIRFLSRKIGARFIRFYTVQKGFVRATVGANAGHTFRLEWDGGSGAIPALLFAETSGSIY